MQKRRVYSWYGNGTIWAGCIDNTCSSPDERTVTLSSQSVHLPQGLMETQQDPETANFSRQCLPRATWNTTEIEASTSSVKIQREGSWKGTRRGKICLLKVCKTDCFVSGLVANSSTLNGHRANKNGYLLSVLVHRLSDLCRTNVFAICGLWHIDFLELWSSWTGFSRIPHFLPA